MKSTVGRRGIELATTRVYPASPLRQEQHAVNSRAHDWRWTLDCCVQVEVPAYSALRSENRQSTGDAPSSKQAKGLSTLRPF